MILSTEYSVRLYPHESLIIFDEVQRYPKARQSIKRLVKDGQDAQFSIAVNAGTYVRAITPNSIHICFAFSQVLF